MKGGKGIWGMPKHQANLDFRIDATSVSSQYDLDGQLAMRITIQRPGWTGLPVHMGAVNFCQFRGMLFKSSIYFQGKIGLSLLRKGAAELLIGDSPRTAPLKELDINPRPLMTAFFPSSAGILDDHYEGWFLGYDDPPTPGPANTGPANADPANADPANADPGRSGERRRPWAFAGVAASAVVRWAPQRSAALTNRKVTFTAVSPFAPTDQDGPDAVRRSLVLAGGGMRVSYQAGALAALEEAGLRFHHVDGTSGGTMNLSMLLAGQSSAEMGERWRALDPRSFSTLSPWLDYVRTPRWPGLGDARGLRDKVFPRLGIDADLIRRAGGITGTYNVCNFATKTAEVIEHTDVDLDLLVAAVSLPVLMPVVTRSGTPYTDAVWIRDSNVPEAVRRGSNEVWLVWCIGNTGTYHNGLFRQYVHMIETAANGSLGRDLAYAAAQWPDRPVRLHVIKPQHPIALDTAYYFGRVDASAFIGLGYQDACRYLNDPRPFSAPWDQIPTRMSEAPPGATVRLVIGGPFAMGGYSPVEGAREGAQKGTSVELHLQVQARSRARNESAVPLSVAGDISLPGQRAHTLIEAGTAELAKAGLTLRLGWRSREQARSLVVAPTGDGRCHTVTLQAGPADGAVVGAGTVSMGWREAARALASLHATDCATTVQGVKARANLALDVLRHGPFFPYQARYKSGLGQSDDEYAR